MSELRGHLRVFGRHGNDVFVFDDCFVRAWTGMQSMMGVALDNIASTGMPTGALAGRAGSELLSRLPGKSARFLSMTPQEILQDDKNNALVLNADVQSAVLSRGRIYRKQRKLVLTTANGTVTYQWSGAPAPRPLNPDAHAKALLVEVLGDRLQVTF